MTAVSPRLEPERAALERMNAFMVDHQLEPHDRAQDLFRPPVADCGRASENRADVIRGVEGVPGGSVGLLPLLVRHFGMVRDPVVEVVLVDVGVHPYPLLQQGLMVLRAGQGGEKKELQDIERQLALNDVNVAQDRVFGVGGEAEDVAREGDRSVRAPLLQHLTVFGDLVLSLLGGDQIVRIDVFKPDEHAFDAGGGRLLDEVRGSCGKACRPGW